MLRILPYPHPMLRHESTPVERVDDAFRAWVREMFALMYESKGIGLAANQVGLPLQFFVINPEADPNKPELEQVFINPIILKKQSVIEDEEGCLSFPGLYGKVTRAKRVRVQAYGLDGERFELDADNLHARAIQHEFDHLKGKLFIDHLSRLTKLTMTPKLLEMERRFSQGQRAGEIPPDDELRRLILDFPASFQPIA